MIYKCIQINSKRNSDIQILNSLNSSPKETPKESNYDGNLISLISSKKNYNKSSTFDYNIKENIFYNNNNIKNGNLNLTNNQDVKKSKTFNENDDINHNANYNQHLNYGQNYLETVIETLNESNSKMDISLINENKAKDQINLKEIKKRIENKVNDIEVKENKLRFQESENNEPSCVATSSFTNTKKNILSFK